MIATRPLRPVEGECFGGVGQDRGRAPRYRIGGEFPSVRLRAGERGEQKAGFHLARIGGDPGDLDIRPGRNGARRWRASVKRISSINSIRLP